jgi:antibiotic biosynthesis monooxygenase (ABM) superfamily enzyme
MARSSDAPVTVEITTQARLGREADYEDWISGITRAAMRFPGHLGANVYRPGLGGRTYRVVFKFDRERNLEHWEVSKERREWYERAEGLVEGPPRVERISGLETWFTLPDQGAIVPPPRYKMATVTWLAIFPLIVVLSATLVPQLDALPESLATVVMSSLLVALMTWIVMPAMTRLFRKWLYPETLQLPDP